MEQHFNAETVERIFDKFPKLKLIITAGTISLKSTREILGIDRYQCNEVYCELLEAGCVKGCGSSMYRATPALRRYMEEHYGSN